MGIVLFWEGIHTFAVSLHCFNSTKRRQLSFNLHFTDLLAHIIMSDFEDDIDDQLLELAGATEKKKKRRQHSSGSAGGGNAGSSSKKRKAEYVSFSFFYFPSAILLLCYVSWTYGGFTVATMLSYGFKSSFTQWLTVDFYQPNGL